MGRGRRKSRIALTFRAGEAIFPELGKIKGFIMFAIFTTGGKQYKVEKGEVLAVEKLDADKKVEFSDVLMADGKVGAPYLSGAKVVAEVVGQVKGDKVLVFKKKRRQNYRRTQGHRQSLTMIRITEITA
jgi:large subunit ribosomal protein L21